MTILSECYILRRCIGVYCCITAGYTAAESIDNEFDIGTVFNIDISAVFLDRECFAAGYMEISFFVDRNILEFSTGINKYISVIFYGCTGCAAAGKNAKLASYNDVVGNRVGVNSGRLSNTSTECICVKRYICPVGNVNITAVFFDQSSVSATLNPEIST